MGKNNKSDDEVFEVESNKAPWTKKHEALFIQIMDEEVKSYSSRQTGCFTKKAWKRILDELNAKTSYEYTQEQIRNKYNTLKTLHTKFTRLCKQTGVGWDGVLGTVNAEEETWERLYKVIDKAKKFRREGFPHYQALSRIFGGTTATGDEAHPSTKTPFGTDSSDPEFKVKEEDLDELEVEKKNPKEKKNKKRNSIAANITTALEGLVESSRRKVDILEKKYSTKSGNESVSTTVNGDQADSNGKFDECMAILDSFEDLDGPSYAKAVKLLHDDASWRAPFMRMSDKRKRDWAMGV